MTDKNFDTKLTYKDIFKSGKLPAIDRLLIGCSFMFAFLVMVAMIVILISTIGNISSSLLLGGLSFLMLALGLVYYSLARLQNPRKAWWFLIISVPVAVLAFILAVV